MVFSQRFFSFTKLLCLLSVVTLPLVSGIAPRSSQAGGPVLAFVDRELELTDDAKNVFWKCKWEMSQVIDKPPPTKKAIARSFPTKRMFMKPNKTVKIGDYREKGVWVLKLKQKTLEMEFDLDPLGNEYLLYQASASRPKYYGQALSFNDGGSVYHVKGLPFPWNKKKIGKFNLWSDDLPPVQLAMKV